MKKKLKKAYKKLAKYEREKEGLREHINSLRIVIDINKRDLRSQQTVIQDLKNALKAPNATQWYEKRIDALEDIIRTGVSSATSYGLMAAQNRELSKEVRELRLKAYGTIKVKR